MCGRYARFGNLLEWIAPLGVDPDRFERLRALDVGPRYNIAPGTNGWLVLQDADGAPVLDERKWTFPTPRGNRINVRSETAHVVPEYRAHFAHHRCVVLANGFYEPKGAKTEKNRPWFFFRARDAAPLYLGAILGPDGFSILTRTPVPPVAEAHDRSPVLVPADNALAWLDQEIPGRQALANLAPPEFAEGLEGWPVSDAAKRAANEGPALIERWSAQVGMDDTHTAAAARIRARAKSSGAPITQADWQAFRDNGRH